MEKIQLDLLSAFSKLKKMTSYNNKERKITLDNYILLSTILEKGEEDAANNRKRITISELAKILEMSKPALAKETRKLQEMGLIKKYTNISDLRKCYVYITDKGIDTIKSTKDYFYVEPNKIIAHIGKKDSKRLVKLLNEVHEILTNEVIKEGIIL